MSESAVERHGKPPATGGAAALWFGVLAGPLAWITQLFMGTELPELMCAVGAEDGSVYGIGIETIIQTLTVVLGGVTALAGLVAMRCWRRVREDDPTPGKRAAWMSLAGVVTSCLFLVLILPGLLPAGFLTECGRSL